MIYGIVCVDKNWGIGKQNNLLFHIKKDMGFFRETTNNTIVCMGEHTFLSLPKQQPLKNRVNIVLCRENHDYEGCICIHSIGQFIKTALLLGAIYPVFIIGGALIYKTMLPYYSKVYVTKVDVEDKEATAFFPNLDQLPEFNIYTESEELTEQNYNFKFVFYERKS